MGGYRQLWAGDDGWSGWSWPGQASHDTRRFACCDCGHPLALAGQTARHVAGAAAHEGGQPGMRLGMTRFTFAAVIGLLALAAVVAAFSCLE
jgi:hypothetical protein